MNQQTLEILSKRLSVSPQVLNKVAKAFDEGNTIPFLARYRKEMIGGLDEQKLFEIKEGIGELKELLKRKEYVLDALKEQNVTDAKLIGQIKSCFDSQLLEDLYAPYKKKRATKASIARSKGLEALAKIIMGQYSRDVMADARRYVRGEVKSLDEAIQGSQDIMTEWISENATFKEYLRDIYRKHGVLVSKKINSKEEKADADKYKDYFEYSEKLSRCPSHRYLALLRGEAQKILRVKIEIDDDRALDRLRHRYVKSQGESAKLVDEALVTAYQKYITPSVVNQVKGEFKVKADIAAIEVFQNNLEHLLLAAPLPGFAVLALDPGFRSGCKVACVDDTGQLLAHTVIYPHPPQSATEEAKHKILSLIKKHDIKAIAIGNGTASRETKLFIDKLLPLGVEVYVISESGASIYSASKIAREEFPHLDLTVRGAISLARRLQDPLSELVKLDPKSIGVGQYQHDVDAKKLKSSLDQTVLTCVNKVGVDLNTASPYVLNYIAGLGESLAKNIVGYREKIRRFDSIAQLKKVPRLGARAFEQAAGFLRVRDGVNALDNTWIHPEAYAKVKSILKGESMTISKVMQDPTVLKGINIEKYVDDAFSLGNLQEILNDLSRPGHDPRGKAEVFAFDDRIKKIEDLKPGMSLPGIVTNVTNFGAFVDIGVKENGLLHISQITDRFISSADEILSVEQKLIVKVLDVDVTRSRISLSLKNGGKILS